mgnify:CR=1 FL=1
MVSSKNLLEQVSEKRARRGLFIYFILVLIGSIPLLWLMIRSAKPINQQIKLVLPLMWVPTVSSFLTRVINKEGMKDISFQIREKEIYLLPLYI